MSHDCCFCGISFIQKGRKVDLPQVSLDASVRILSTISRATFTQTFRSPSNCDTIKEGQYSFPLYADSAVVSFTCKIAERVIEGVVKPKDTAKAIYERAKAGGERAGLLEQNSGDVFTTSLGNIPPDQDIQVVITTISELKHDPGIDGIQLTVPVAVAPRYGTPPKGLAWSSVAKGGMTLKVEIAMPENIRLVSSPSHPVSTEMGGWSTEADGDFDPTKAIATLQQTTATLNSDFILLIRTQTPSTICTPQAILETHPTIPGQKALMTTLVPRFQLPPNSTGKPEIVFVADRSGSMGCNMEPLRSALRVFLKSIPLGCHFNIISFGSEYDKLWPTSKKYSADSLEEALRLVNSMDANYGGTEMLAPVKAAISDRLIDINTEIILLTDGETWDFEDLLACIRQARRESNMVRTFTIGVGDDVSHELVESVARIGAGYSQIIDTNEATGWENRVVGMLKAALGEHFDNCTLEVEEEEVDDGYDMVDISESETSHPSESEDRAPMESKHVLQTLALFDPTVKPPQSSKSDSSAVNLDSDTSDQFAHLKQLVRPEPLQTPHKIPALFPFQRTSVYLLFTKPTKAIKNVRLKATLTSGVEVVQTIPVSISQKSDTIHKLAARAMLRDLYDGTSWLSDTSAGGIDHIKNLARFKEYAEKEGIEIAMMWGLASQWTSFVAVENGSETSVPQVAQFRAMVRRRKRRMPKSQSVNAFLGFEAEVDDDSEEDFSDDIDISERFSCGTPPGNNAPVLAYGSFEYEAPPFSNNSIAASPCYSLADDAHDDHLLGASPNNSEVDKLSAEPPTNDEQRVLRLIDLQSFEGGFEDYDAVLLILGLSARKMNIETRAEELGQTLQVWITAVVVAYLRNKLAAYHDIFDLVLDKAVNFGREHVKVKSAGNIENAWEALERAASGWVDEQ